MKRLMLLIPAAIFTPWASLAQCVATLTYTPAHPVSGQEMTFTFKEAFEPGYTPPVNADTRQLFTYRSQSGNDIQFDGASGMTLSVPGSVTFNATPYYAGLFTVNAAAAQRYAFGYPPACSNGGINVGVEQNLSVLIAPSGQGDSGQNLSLKGQYLFQFVGSTPEALPTNKVVGIGSFTADGEGRITSGIEDLNSAESSRESLPIFSGTYHVDGAIGSIEILTPLGAQHLDMFNSIDQGQGIQSAALIYTDSSPIGSGTLIKQAPSSLSGAYFINLQGFAPANTGLESVLTPAALVGLVAFSPGGTTAYFDFASPNTGFLKGVNAQGAFTNADTNGRFTYDLKVNGVGSGPTHFVGYTSDLHHFFTMSLDNYQTNYLFTGTGAQQP